MPIQHSIDLLIEAQWVLPIAPVNGALAGHGVAVTDGRIVAVGPIEELEQQFAPRERVSRPHHAVMPGFVNAHTHAAMTLMRGLPVRAPVMRWLRETVWPTEQRFLSRDYVREGTQLAIAEMLRAGITCCADMYLFPDEAARAMAAARMRVVIGLPVADEPSEWAENATAYIDKALRMWDEYKTNPWVSLQFAPHVPYSISDETLARVRRMADEIDARIAMPMHETEVEIQDSLASHGKRPLHRLDDLGLLRPGFTAIHMNRLDEEDLERVARTGISVIVCPQSDLRLGSGTAPVVEMLSRDVMIGIGTSSAASVGALDMLAEARMIALTAGFELGARSLVAEEALRLATLGSATSLGLGATIGSLEPGKSADLICIDLETLACQPAASPADAIVFAATRQQITDVWIAGRAAVSDSRLLTFDEQELLHTARQWAGRIYPGVIE